MTKSSESYECSQCFDTGCACGGIGLSCHGCCSCAKGDHARTRRIRAVGQAAHLVQTMRRSGNDKKELQS